MSAKHRLSPAPIEKHFSPESDIDVLVEFDLDHIPGLEFFKMEAELSEMFGRKVDLNIPQFLSEDFNDQALREAEDQYVSA